MNQDDFNDKTMEFLSEFKPSAVPSAPVIDFHKPHEPIEPGEHYRCYWPEARCVLIVERFIKPENTYCITTWCCGKHMEHESEFVSSEAAMEYGVLWIRERIRA